LREDFLGPLREGIQKFCEIVADNLKRKSGDTVKLDNELQKKLCSIDSLHTYFNVKFTTNVCDDTGFHYAIQLENSKARAINWQRSKRLIFGSLVCLSDDYFRENFIVATINNRDDDQIKMGILTLKIESMYHGRVKNDKNYTMLETSAYFESYNHVLCALRSLNKLNNDFPFKEYLVDAEMRKMQPANYLQNARIDFRILCDGPKRGKFSPTLDYAKECHVLNENEWPTAQQLALDDSQYQALKMALTKKITIIQGYFESAFVFN
jgi:hypothetical protein